MYEHKVSLIHELQFMKYAYGNWKQFFRVSVKNTINYQSSNKQLEQLRLCN